MGLGEFGTHADDLAALSGEEECYGHAGGKRSLVVGAGFTTLPTRRQACPLSVCPPSHPCRRRKLRYNGAATPLRSEAEGEAVARRQGLGPPPCVFALSGPLGLPAPSGVPA
jgi:hypothetical protein